MKSSVYCGDDRFESEAGVHEYCRAKYGHNMLGVNGWSKYKYSEELIKMYLKVIKKLFPLTLLELPVVNTSQRGFAQFFKLTLVTFLWG